MTAGGAPVPNTRTGFQKHVKEASPHFLRVYSTFFHKCVYLRCSVQGPFFNVPKVLRSIFKALTGSSSWFPGESPGCSACPTDHEKLAFSWGNQPERRQPTPCPQANGCRTKSCFIQGAPLWLSGEDPCGACVEQRGYSPLGHRGVAKTAPEGQLRPAISSKHQDLRKPNCSILLDD